MAETRLSIDYGDGNYEPISDPPESEFRKYRKTALTEAQQMAFPFKVKTEHGWVEAAAGDYLMRGGRGELYPCAQTEFLATYEQA